MSAGRLDEARMIMRLRAMRLRAAHLRLAAARRETASAERLHHEAETCKAEAARAVADRRAMLSGRPERAEAMLLLLACAREDHGAAALNAREAEAALVSRRDEEARQRQIVVRDKARRDALDGRVAALRRGLARIAEEAAAGEAEDCWRPRR